MRCAGARNRAKSASRAPATSAKTSSPRAAISATTIWFTGLILLCSARFTGTGSLMMLSLAAESSPRGITLNGIALDWTETELTAREHFLQGLPARGRHAVRSLRFDLWATDEVHFTPLVDSACSAPKNPKLACPLRNRSGVASNAQFGVFVLILPPLASIRGFPLRQGDRWSWPHEGSQPL
jgi:NAD(P)-dependent dehydrogenase (short-subunit alcohol dehydrogenase family)